MSTTRTVTSIADLYPNLPAEEQAEIEDAFDRYLKLVIRIADGALADPERAELINSLTVEPPGRTLESGRSNIANARSSNE